MGGTETDKSDETGRGDAKLENPDYFTDIWSPLGSFPPARALNDRQSEK
jgi:hypothetical protein